MSNKKQNQTIHAKKRADERFGINLNKHKRRELIQMIFKGNARHLEKISNRLSKFRVRFEDKLMDIIYDKNRKRIVTFLYPEWHEEKLAWK